MYSGNRFSFYSEQMQDALDFLNDDSIQQTPDGGVLIDLDENGHNQNYSFQENLVNVFAGRVCSSIGYNLKSAIEEDFQSRSEWETALTEGISQLGLVVEEKQFPFPGACGVYSGAYMNALITFVSSATAELLPPDGPVSVKIEGESTTELEDQADRVQYWLNLYLTRLAPEYYSDWEQALNWFAISGNLFKKVYFDPLLRRPVSLYIKPQDLIINFGVTSLESASRITQVLEYNERDIKTLQNSGFYADISLTAQNEDYGDSELSKKVDAISGMSYTSGTGGDYNTRYKLYECHVDLYIEEDDQNDTDIPAPYIATLEAATGTLISLYRNWSEGDLHRKKRNYFVHARYFPGLGFYGLGLAHIVGGTAKAATIIERQLIDAGTLSNFPGGLRVKGMRMDTNNIRMGPTEFTEIDTGGVPISQAIMVMPYKEPSQILHQMKVELEENIMALAGATNQQFSDMNPNSPVGTTLALLEQTHKVQSSVLRRLHRAMGAELGLLFKLFGENLPEQPYPFNVPGGSYAIMRADFHPSLAVSPVSDPNISSSAQRLVRAEALLRFAQQAPDLHNMREAYENVYRELKISHADIDKLLPPKPEEQEIQPLDPLTENQNMSTGKPVNAALWQDHDAHITMHNLLLGGENEQLNATVQAHIQMHVAYKLQQEIQGRLDFQLPDNLAEVPQDVQNQIAAQMAVAAQQILQEREANMPPKPVDPGEAMMRDIAMKEKANDQRAQIDQQKMQIDADTEQQKLQLQQQKIQIDAEIEQQRLQLQQQKLMIDSESEQQKSLIAQQKLQIDEMKLQLQARIEEMKGAQESVKIKTGIAKEKMKLTQQKKIADSKLKIDQKNIVSKELIAKDKAQLESNKLLVEQQNIANEEAKLMESRINQPMEIL